MSKFKPWERMVLREAEGTGSSGGATAAKPDPKTGTTGNQGDGNNGDDFSLDNGNIWEAPKPKEGDIKPAPVAQTQNQPAPGPSGFDQYIQSLDYTPTITPEIQASLAQGDMSGLMKQIGTQIQSSLKEALIKSAQIARQAATEAQGNAVNQANVNFNSANAIKVLNDKVPISTNPNIAPIAKAAMTQYMKAGNSAEKSAMMVGKFLGALSKQPNQAFGLPDQPKRGTGGSMRDEPAEPEVDWLEFASGN